MPKAVAQYLLAFLLRGQVRQVTKIKTTDLCPHVGDGRKRQSRFQKALRRTDQSPTFFAYPEARTGAHSAKLKVSVTGLPHPACHQPVEFAISWGRLEGQILGRANTEKRSGGPVTIFIVMQAKKGTFKFH